MGQAGRSIKCPFHPTAELKVFSSPSPRQAELPPPPPDRCVAPHAAHSCRLCPFLARQKPIFSPANEGTNASDKVPLSEILRSNNILLSPGANVFLKVVCYFSDPCHFSSVMLTVSVSPVQKTDAVSVSPAQ